MSNIHIALTNLKTSEHESGTTMHGSGIIALTIRLSKLHTYVCVCVHVNSSSYNNIIQ